MLMRQMMGRPGHCSGWWMLEKERRPGAWRLVDDDSVSECVAPTVEGAENATGMKAAEEANVNEDCYRPRCAPRGRRRAQRRTQAPKNGNDRRAKTSTPTLSSAEECRQPCRPWTPRTPAVYACSLALDDLAREPRTDAGQGRQTPGVSRGEAPNRGAGRLRWGRCLGQGSDQSRPPLG